MPQAVLGVAFSMGIPMAFAAVLGDLPVWLWLLVVSNLMWVLAYDTEYAMVDRDDDLKIGMKTSAITLGRLDVAGVMLFYMAHLLLWAVAVWPWVGGVWVALSWLLAVGQAAWHYRLIRQRARDGCFKAFRLNHWLGLTLFVGVVLQLAAA
jgi:4-hydroxybenzoate polyprenyltransferase